MKNSTTTKQAGYEIVDFEKITPDSCPCGSSRRAFVDGDGTMSLHRVEIQGEDKPHKHDTDELYVILSCGNDAAMILDGNRYPIKQGQAVKISGGILHCADRGNELMIVLVVVATGHGSPESKMTFE